MRLTRDDNIISVLDDRSFAFECFLRLKQYEDTGYSPEEISRIIRENKRREKLIKSVRLEVEVFDAG